MTCLKKFFLKDRGSWTPKATGFTENGYGEISRRYTVIDFDSEKIRYLNFRSTSNIKHVNTLNNKSLLKKKVEQKGESSTSHGKGLTPKHRKKYPLIFPQTKNKACSAILVDPKSSQETPSSTTQKPLAQTPSYLEELKEKQNILHEKKIKTDYGSERYLRDYEELIFGIRKRSGLMESPQLKKLQTTSQTHSQTNLNKTHKQCTKQNSITHPTCKITVVKQPQEKDPSFNGGGEQRKYEESSQTERDSGVHIDVGDKTEIGTERNDAAEIMKKELPENKTSSPPLSIGRKEGLIFTRTKLSKENEKFIKVFKKDERTRMLIRNAIEENDFLNNYMDSERKELVIDAMEPATYETDSFIIREDEEGSEIYVSDEGVFNVIKNNEIINTFGAGHIFGELAILYNAKRFASIKVLSKAKVWKIERRKFRTIMVISGSKEHEENMNFLRSVPLLRELPEEVLLRIVDILKRVFFPAKTCIVRQGNIGNDFFIIRGGSVTIMKTTEEGEDRIVCQRKRGEYFGEQALLNEDRRLASVYADAPGTECLKLDRVSFISYLGTIPELKKKPIDGIAVIEEKRSSTISNRFDHIQLSDLDRVATLGVGGFGRVDLVSYKGTHTFALKVLRKIDIIKQEQIDHVYSEKIVMQLCHSPFIVELYATFRDSKCVYFLMEACLGGDVWTIMHQRQYFEERTARFIVACVVEAFEFLHTRNIIYRDLKPENLMLTPDGYCKLVDFGFAKRMTPNYKTNTFAGTPEYVAPEIILDRGHDRAVDYWALGILIHELISGRPPFRGKDQMKIYQQILGGIEAVKMSTRIPKQPQNLIKNLCKQMPAERLGYQKKGIVDIKKHCWFEGFDWIKLQNKSIPAPIKRPVRNNTDLRYFTPNQESFDTPPDEISGWDSHF